MIRKLLLIFPWNFLLSQGMKNIFLAIFFNPFQANVPFLYPLKTSDNLWFSDVFRGGIEKNYWHEMGQSIFPAISKFSIFQLVGYSLKIIRNNRRLDIVLKLATYTLREKCPNTEFFLVRIQSESGKILTRKNYVFVHFSCSDKNRWEVSQLKI